MAITNEAHVLFAGLPDLTFEASAAVTGARFVTISEAADSGPLLNNSGEGATIHCAHATAAGAATGVSRYDVAEDAKGTLVRSGSIVEVDASATIAPGVEVQAAADGKSAVLASGRPLGQAVTAGSNGNRHYVLIY